MSQQNLGRIQPKPKGNWSSGAAYKYLDIVTQDGNSYILTIATSTGQSPASTADWQMIAAKGADGAAGATGAAGSNGAAGATGAQGAAGQGFEIETIFNSVAELQAGSISSGKFGLVAGTLSQDHDDYGKLYYRDGSSWSYITDMSVPGAAGIQGPSGSDGAKGDKGDKGDTGAAGADGATGATGATGAQGATGVQGATGAAGADGNDFSGSFSIDGNGDLILTTP